MAVPAQVGAMTMTVEEFLAHPTPEGKAELVRGELRVTPPPGSPHGVAAFNLALMLGNHVKRHALGRVFGDGFGYELVQLPRTVRGPDGSFVRAERLPPDGVRPGLLKLAPDLAIEVLTTSETASDLQEKLDDYRAAGTSLVWVVDPLRRTVMVMPNDAPVRWLHEGDTLDGGNVIAGFACLVSEIFEGIAREG